MAVDLSDYVDVLRREITPPGTTLFSTVEDNDLALYLADAFWEARLDGLLDRWESDEDGLVTPVDPSGPEITRDRIALIVLYASIRMLRNHLMNTNTSFRAAAGPVEFEVQNSANMLTEMLNQLKETKDRLLDREGEYGATVAYLTDGYSVRNASSGAYFGFLDDYFAALGT